MYLVSYDIESDRLRKRYQTRWKIMEFVSSTVCLNVK